MFADFIFTSFLSMIFLFFLPPVYCLLLRDLFGFFVSIPIFIYLFIFFQEFRQKKKEKKHPQHDQKIYNKNRTRVKTKNKYSFVQKL